MSENEVLEIHAYDWVVRDAYSDDGHVAIHCWALDRYSKPYLVRFNNFPAFCYIELPPFIRNRWYNWNRGAVEQFMNMLNARLKDDAPYDYKIIYNAKKIYYYQKKHMATMIRVSFNTLNAMRHCSNLLEKPINTEDWGFMQCNVWEDNNSISIVRKLLTVQN